MIPAGKFHLLTITRARHRRIDLNGEIESPLRWAIDEGKHAIARCIIQDLTAIRADREAYYYGREALWQTHPDIVKALCTHNSDEILQACDAVCGVCVLPFESAHHDTL